jgi:hypothetical protein
MILTEVLNKAIRDTVSTIIGGSYVVVAAKQSGAPRPSGGYADVDFLSQLPMGWDERSFENTGDDLTENIAGMREVVMTIGFYRDNATDNARKVHSGLMRESIRSLFDTVGIGLTSRGIITDISETLETTWEERATFDITLNLIGDDSDIVGSITSVEIDGAFRALGAVSNVDYTIEIQ